jgi:hypothetical protein
MAEKTEVEKVQESFERKLKEQEMQFERTHARELEIIRIRYDEIHSVREEQKKELLAQNDGLLGAVGRLHTENEALKTRVSELGPALAKAKEEATRMLEEMKERMEFANARAQELIEGTKREAQHEIDRLKGKLSDLQKRKKKA